METPQHCETAARLQPLSRLQPRSVSAPALLRLTALGPKLRREADGSTSGYSAPSYESYESYESSPAVVRCIKPNELKSPAQLHGKYVGARKTRLEPY